MAETMYEGTLVLPDTRKAHDWAQKAGIELRDVLSHNSAFVRYSVTMPESAYRALERVWTRVDYALHRIT